MALRAQADQCGTNCSVKGYFALSEDQKAIKERQADRERADSLARLNTDNEELDDFRGLKYKLEH